MDTRRCGGSGGTGERRPEEVAELRRTMGSDGGTGERRPEDVEDVRRSMGRAGASVDEVVETGESEGSSGSASSSTLCE